MEDLYNNLNTSTTIVNDCLIITLPNDIIDKEIEMGFNRILTIIERTSVKGAILNLSMISSLDTSFFKVLRKNLKDYCSYGA